MSELSRRCKNHANPRKWKKIHEGWVGNKSTQFPSLTSFTLSIEKLKKQNKVESAVKCCIIIMDGQDQPRIRNKSFLGYKWHVLNLRCKWMPTNKASG